LPLVGIVPDVAFPGRATDPARQIASQPLTAFAEGFRNLRAYLALSAPTARSNIIAVTSAVPGEGRTLVSICLATTLAAAGARVVLLDCDFRSASASKFFAKPAFGIAEVVAQSIPVEQALTYDAKSGIWFLSASATNAVPNDILSKDRVDNLLAALSAQFDHVVIDTLPLLGFADARILVSKADCVLFVILWNKTAASMIRAAGDILRQCSARVAGAVLNKVDVKQQARYGFADGSDYYHYYGSAYAPQS